MEKNISQTILLAAATGWAALINTNAHADNSAVPVQSEFPSIIAQPEDQMVPFGSNAVFNVTAVNTDGCQWLRNGSPLDGQTNTSLVISNCDIKDVGYYSCNLYKDIETVPTRSASLMVYTNTIDPQTGVDPVVVFGFPVSGSGGSGTCPGHYAGYVNYTKTIAQGWGWVPDTTNGNTLFTASDTNRTDTKIQYLGKYGDNNCNPTTVTIPSPASSPTYRFTIFFTNNVPTNAYTITLDGFNP
jgi:hypothetical protein